ncbi:hypothetical protein EEB11_14840 [Pseudotabrizicola sediminis]|uniref:Uncharacterized protein n=1 Tax=Pseudotabrizicola sediminis TaxID=2486418 RepID=A0ABY2KLY1_9RHOB|nr:hypothetical protein [Pseudotabrizicola sediminis]TGD42241.1 hypothetical protein EEB11_14840 [Pseudotabrizicola sediminis]
MDTDDAEADHTVTSDGYRKASLEAARMAEFVFATKSDDACAFVTALTDLTKQHEAERSPRDRARTQRAEGTFRVSLGAFAADLIFHSKNAEAEGFTYRSVDKEAMGQTLVTVCSFEKARHLWKSLGLLETTSFFRAKDAWEDGDPLRAYFGRTGRYRATPALLALAARFHIEPNNLKEHFQKELGRIASVQVKGEQTSKNGMKAQPITIKKKGPRFDLEIKRVDEINHYLAAGEFDLSDVPVVNRSFSRGNLSIFNFDQGGRLYCRSDDNWQSMPGDRRSRIRCGGEPTVELDVRASHMFILYALHPNFNVPSGDPYFVEGIERNVVKGLVTAVFGIGGFPKTWPKGFNRKNELGDKGPVGKVKLSRVLDLICSKHPVLHKVKVGVMDWGRLQYEESECFVEASLDLGRNHKIAALPVHDSLIVAVSHTEATRTAMLAAYQGRFGRTPEIKVSKAVIS